MPQPALRVGVISRDAPPRHCGVGDHSVCLADALNAHGAETRILAFGGSTSGVVSANATTEAGAWLDWLVQELQRLQSEHVLLQYTPLYYQDIPAWSDARLRDWWSSLERRYATSLVVHETYYRTLRRPRTLVSGTRQKRTLKALARGSDVVFTASDVLLRELQSWELRRAPVLLPIGSNLPRVEGSRETMRERYGIEPDTAVLTLFGGGNTLKWMSGFVNAVSNGLDAHGLAHRWLLLGGVPEDWFELSQRALAPGRLSPELLSEHLSMTDLFLMPHHSGLCAKRGTLMAAMQHGLPVVGTRGPMTDSFWDSVTGVRVTECAVSSFVGAVTTLVADLPTRQRMGAANENHYDQHFDWRHIARTVMTAITRPPSRVSPKLHGSVASI